jgi:hypothetical protein
MIPRNISLTVIAVGIIFFVSGVYGIARNYSLFVVGSGILFILFGVIFLLLASRPLQLSVPHFCVIAFAIAAIGLHAYEEFYKSDGAPSIRYLLWAMMPYGLCIVLSAFRKIRKVVILGIIFAFVFDLWGYYAVFINPQSSTAALVLLFIPLWNTVILVPLMTFIAWLITKIKSPQEAAP